MLVGPRVTLRALRRDGLPRLLLFNDLAVAASGGRDDGRFAIEAGGRFVGTCGRFHWDATGRADELGIGIGEQALWGRGLGREAVGLLLGHGFRPRDLRWRWASGSRGGG